MTRRRNSKTLETLWGELATAGRDGAFRRVDESHPLDLYIGVDPTGSRVFVLVTDFEPPLIPQQAKGLAINSAQRSDGRWALSVKLRVPEFGRIFAHLCEDLVEASRHCAPLQAASFVTDRITRWERLLTANRGSGMDEKAFRGLVAEIYVLLHMIIPTYGADQAVEAWMGPLEADQDFRLSDRLVEVKSTVVGSQIVTISSIEQLDVTDFPLYLVTVPVGLGSNANATDTSLNELIDAARTQLQTNAEARCLFEDRLCLTGYIREAEYAGRCVSVGEPRSFFVDLKFPRLVRSATAPAIRNARYELDLALCRGFERPFIAG